MCSCQDEYYSYGVSGPVDTWEGIAGGDMAVIAKVGGGVLVSEAVKGQVLSRFPALKGRIIESVPVTYESLVHIAGGYFGITSDSSFLNGFGASMAWALVFNLLGIRPPVRNFFKPANVQGIPFDQLKRARQRKGLDTGAAARRQAAANRVMNNTVIG